MSDKKKIDKTTRDWIFELIVSFFRTRRIVAVIVLLLIGSYAVQLGFFEFRAPVFVQFGAAVLLIPIALLLVIEFIARAIGPVSDLLHPSTSAIDILIRDNVTVVLADKPEVAYSFGDIERVSLSYDWRGVFIRAHNGAHTYTLPFNPNVIEQKLDRLTNFAFNKETEFIESKDGNIRTVWYNKK